MRPLLQESQSASSITRFDSAPQAQAKSTGEMIPQIIGHDGTRGPDNRGPVGLELNTIVAGFARRDRYLA